MVWPEDPDPTAVVLFVIFGLVYQYIEKYMPEYPDFELKHLKAKFISVDAAHNSCKEPICLECDPCNYLNLRMLMGWGG